MLILGETKIEGEQKEILVADLNNDCQLLLLSVVDDFHKSYLSLCHVSLSYTVLRSCNGLYWFPHYAWDEDVMYLVIICKFLMYMEDPHLVG